MADIYFVQSDPKDAGRFRSGHWVHTILGKYPGTNIDKHIITLTGIVVVDYKGITSDQWRRDNLHLLVSFPGNILPSDKLLQLENWAPFVALSSLFNQDEAINAGWAVDDFGLDVPWDRRVANFHIVASVAVRDSDGWLFRVGYNLTVSGFLVDRPGPE